jgi:hypothetical protein
MSNPEDDFIEDYPLDNAEDDRPLAGKHVRQKKPANTVRPVERNEEIEDMDFESDLTEWLSQKNIDNAQPTVHLYKFDNPLNNKEKSLYGTYKDHIPTEDEIGLECGSGRYFMIVKVPDGAHTGHCHTTTRSFKIGVRYDMLREARKPAQAAVPYHNPQETAQQAFTMVERMMAMILPALLNKPQEATNPGLQMASMYSAMNKILNEQAIGNLETMQGLQRKMLDVTTPQTEEELPTEEPEKEKTFMENIIGLLNNPGIMSIVSSLTSHSPQASVASQVVKTIPQVQEVMRNPAQVAETVRFLDGKFGAAKTNVILSNLKIKRPASVPAMIPVQQARPRKVVKKNEHVKSNI